MLMQYIKGMNARTLLILIVGMLILSACAPKTGETLIMQTFPETGEPIGVYGWVGVKFSQPMQTKSVEDSFSISPSTTGVFFWQNDTFWFRPMQAFRPEDDYQAHLAGDLQTTDGQTIAIEISWDFSIREPGLVYYVPLDGQREIWRAEADGSNPQRLSSTGGKAVEFMPDRTGTWIAFTVENQDSGRDLWIIDRDGSDQRVLVDCSRDICSEPAWSLDGARIAYTRENYDSSTGGYQPSQVWTADTLTGDTAQLYQSEDAFGHSPSFSPDGEKLASYDTTHNVIRILDLLTSQESVVPRVLPGSGDWSPDGKQLLFTDVLPAENEPFVTVYIVDLLSQQVKTAFQDPITDTDFSQPRWSPDGGWVAASLRPVNSNVSKALWVLNLEHPEVKFIADDPSATFSAYRWDPWGDRLVYQRLELGSSDPLSSIWMWDWETQQSTLIIEKGSRPEWLH